MFLFRRRKDQEDKGAGLDAIRERPRIIKILREAQKERSPLEVKLSGRGQSYSSVILDVRPETSNPFIIIDTLLPQEGNLLLKDAPFLVGSFLIKEKGVKENRMPYEMSANFVSTVMVENLPAIRLTFPHVLRRNQRREYLRVEPPVRTCIWFRSKEKEFKGLVANISGGGVGFYIKMEAFPLGPGSPITDVRFDCGDLPVIPKGVVVYILKPLTHQIVSKEDYFRHYCGAEFREIDESVREKIVRYVVEVERKELKSLDRRFVQAVTGPDL